MPAAPDRDFLFSSESVTEGHPDKLADQISDAVLDAVMAEDPTGRVACEVLLSKGLVVVAGEVTTDAEPDYEGIVRGVLRDVGYTGAEVGIDADACEVQVTVSRQSPDIAQGVDPGGAGDQGMMFGYATRETPEFMPLPIVLAHGLTHRLAEVRRDGTLDYLRPDGKSQVTVRYRGGAPDRVTSVVLAAQHGDDVASETLRDDVKEHVIRPVLDDRLGDGTDYYINHTGRFVLGGPAADAGLTGRKIIVDTYGGWAPHGGGAFSGKDPTKVDRSAAYYARYVAKNLVGAGVAERAQVHVAYSIGSTSPMNVTVDTFGTGVVPDEDVEALVADVFDFAPGSIIEQLDLRRPIYRQTAAYGHFGRNDLDLPWERLDRVDELGEAVKGV